MSPTTASHVAREIHRILLPIAGSSAEDGAIEYTALIAAALHASVAIVHVDEMPNAMVGIVPGASVAGDLAAERAASKTLLDWTAARLASLGVTDIATAHVTSFGVAPALVEFARGAQTDLIIMSTHARTGFARVMLGSVADHVLRHAPCPVMTIHPT